MAKARQKTIESLRRAAVPEPEERAEQFPHQLSGGLRQRVMIAMAIAGGSRQGNGTASAGPRLLIADEPTTALDVSVGAQVLLLLQELQREFGLTYIFISHSLPVVAQLATRIAVMRAGQFVGLGAAEQILKQPAHPYTGELLAAVPELLQA